MINIKKKYFPIPQCELLLYTPDSYETIINKIKMYSIDENEAKKRLYNIGDYLFIIRLNDNGFVLIPEQTNHYGNHNGAMPEFFATFVENMDDNNILKMVARSDFLIAIFVIIVFSSVLCFIGGKFFHGIIIYIIANALSQVFFWVPFYKVLTELEIIFEIRI